MPVKNIYLDNGIGYCPNCLAKKLKFRLSPHLLPTTIGTDIPLFCRHCKTEYVVDIVHPSVASISTANTSRHADTK